MTEDRRKNDPWRADITQRMQVMEGQHVALREAVEANTDITKSIQTNTDEIIEFFKAGKGFFTMIGYLSKAAKWITAILAAAGAIYAGFHLGGDK